MNKNISVLIIIILVAIGAYFFLMKNDEATTTTGEEQVETKDYIGLSESEAETKAQAEGVMFRVVEIDGKQQPTTRDFQEGRINAVIEGGVVTSYTVESRNPTVKDDNESEPASHDAIIGLTTTEAEAYAKANSVDYRVGTIDGEGLPVTLDFRPGRITAEIKNDVVIGYTVE